MGTVDRELVSGALAKLLRDAVAAVARGVDLSCALRQETQDCVFEISAPLMPVLETDSAADGARRERRVAPGVMLAEVVAGRHGGSLQVLTDAEQRNVRLRLPLRTAAVGA
jgi:hypothetical protein